MSTELVNLTFQIEELLHRFQEGSKKTTGEADHKGSDVNSNMNGTKETDTECCNRIAHSCSIENDQEHAPSRSSVGKVNASVLAELHSFKQRVQVLERRVSQLGDLSYVHRLEEKVLVLSGENSRLEEERSEMEEAENDLRHRAQRYSTISLFVNIFNSNK